MFPAHQGSVAAQPAFCRWSLSEKFSQSARRGALLSDRPLLGRLAEDRSIDLVYREIGKPSSTII